ncbi:molybdopterin guanine dinucleotide-containing S/N-oxide reductase [Achromobacter aloeverae]
MTGRTYTAAHWGLYEVTPARNGGRPTLRPFHDDPDPSEIGLHMGSREVARNRVLRPAVREGWLRHARGLTREDTRARGDERFVEVGWDEALNLASRELARVRSAHGNGAIFGGSYGWSSAGRFHHAQSQVHRFLNAIGGYVRHMDSYSLAAARTLMPYLVMPMDELMADHTDWKTLREHCQLFVTFGGVPRKNAQIAVGGTARHLVKDSLRELAGHGVRFINISPVRSDIDTGRDFEWMPIRPNTDTALILGIAHTLLAEDRHDKRFIQRYCVGFEKFEQYVLGHEDGVAKTAAWASGITGIGEKDIIALARDMAGARCMINMAWSLQRAHHGEQPYWALLSLAAMLGQIGTPGGGFGVCYGAENLMGSRYRKFRGPTLSQGRGTVDDFIPVARIADMLLHPGDTYTYCGQTRSYPDIRLVYWAGGNPFHHHQDLNRLLRAWRKPETIIVNEQYWTPTAKLADIVFPATTSLERNDIFYAQREPYVAPMKRAMAPEGESRDDYAIFSELAARLGAEETFTEGRDEMQWLEHLYDEWIGKARDAGVRLPSFQAFWSRDLVEIEQLDEPVVLLSDFRENPEAHPLKTASGKIEIFCERIAGYGHDDCPGHAVWIEPHEWLGSGKARIHPFHLITDQPARRLHSQLDHSPHSIEAKIQGREPVWIHPEDAKERGIRDGDVVRLYNARGSCLAGALLTADVRRNVLKLSTGAWFDPENWTPGNHMDKHGNPNVLTADVPASSFSQGCSAQTCLVDIERYAGAPPRVTAHDLPFLSRGEP